MPTNFKSPQVRRNIECKRWLRRLSQKAALRSKRRSQQISAVGSICLRAPKFFHLGDPKTRGRLIDFLRLLRNAIYKYRKPVKIDFKATERMYSCGTLLLVAELDRLLRIVPKADISCRLPKNNIVHQVLQQVGLLRLLRNSARLQEGDFDPSVKHWRFATGSCVDASQISNDIWDSMEGVMTPALNSSIYTGITEAMTNSVNHAYVEARQDGVAQKATDRRWWMFSQELDGYLHVVMCDLGIGIPRSLPRTKDANPGWEETLSKFLSLFAKPKREAAMIKAALEIGKTRTNLPHRGKGLRQIVDAIKVAGNDAEVKIYSNCGAYSMKPHVKLDGHLIQYKDSIMGTLIQWRVPVAKQES